MTTHIGHENMMIIVQVLHPVKRICTSGFDLSLRDPALSSKDFWCKANPAYLVLVEISDKLWIMGAHKMNEKSKFHANMI